MALEEAYSTELDEIIDADVAYDLYWSGKLTDQRKFTCPGDNCGVQVTCACMTIVEQDLKKSPYFTVSEHKDSCSLFGDENHIDYINSCSNSYGSHQIKSKKEKFEFSRPPSHTEGNGSKVPGTVKPTSLSTPRGAGVSSGNNLKRMFSIKSIINRWVDYREAGTVEIKTIDMEREITYKNLFKDNYGLKLENLSDERFIYFSTAYFNKLKNGNGYKIAFRKPFKVDDKNVYPTFFISNDMMENYQIKSLLTKRIKKLANSDDNIGLVFLYSKPYINKSYVNFSIDNLDLLDIRNLDFFEKLKLISN